MSTDNKQTSNRTAERCFRCRRIMTPLLARDAGYLEPGHDPNKLLAYSCERDDCLDGKFDFGIAA